MRRKKCYLPREESGDITLPLRSMLDGKIPAGEQVYCWIRNRARALAAFAGVPTITVLLMNRLLEEGIHLSPMQLAAHVVDALPEKVKEEITLKRAYRRPKQ
jgi:hypothetical protein